MTTRAETIARLLNQAGTHLKNGIAQPLANGCIDAAMNCVHQALLETLGPVASPAPAAEGGLRAYKPECNSGDCILPMGHAEDHWDGHGAWPRVSPAAEGPWVVRVEHNGCVWWDPDADGPRSNEAHVFDRLVDAEAHALIWQRSRVYPGAIATVLSLAEAEREEAEQASLDRLPAHTKAVLAELVAEKMASSSFATELAAVKAERDTARAERDAAKAERDKLTTDEADLRYALRTIASLVGGAVALGASTEMHCAVVDEVRLVVERLKRKEALRRDHSEVIAQCEEALHRPRTGYECERDSALRAALAALRGAP